MSLLTVRKNIDLLGTDSDNDILDELLNGVGSSAFNLDHDSFLGSTEIWTGSGKTGTQLVENTDYVLDSVISNLSNRVGASVYSKIIVTNVTYQTGDLYFNYHVVADLVNHDFINRFIGAITIDDSDHIGIGTTSPNKLFSVAGDSIIGQDIITGESFIYLGEEAASDKSFVISYDHDNNYARLCIHGDANPLGINIANGGNIGIGINNPVSTLHIYEDTVTTGTAAGITIEQDGTGDAIAHFLLTGAQRWLVGIDNSDSDSFKITPGSALDTIDAFTIDTSGNVGIGTSSPANLLVAHGGVNDGRLQLTKTTYGTAIADGAWLGIDDNEVYLRAIENIDMSFWTNNVERMTILADGNVGIGTNSPVAKLEVSDTSAGSVQSIIQNTTEAVNASTTLYMRTGATGSALGSTNAIALIRGIITQATPSSLKSDLTFWTNSGDAISEKMRIDSSGNVGIGTSTPAASALLDLTSTTGALLLPRMTTTQRNALTGVNGMMIYNVSTDDIDFYAAGAWETVAKV